MQSCESRIHFRVESSDSRPNFIKRTMCCGGFAGELLRFRDYFEAILFPQLLLLTLVVSWADDKLGVKVLPLALETDDRYMIHLICIHLLLIHMILQ